MKHFVFSILFLTLTQWAMADTIDYWHVYYNDRKLKELTYYTDNTITIKSSEIAFRDSIRIFFFRDTPCEDCETNLYVIDTDDAWVIKTKNKGFGNALSFSLAELSAYKKRTGKRTFQVCYFDKMNIFQAKKPILVTIKLE